jgi:glycerophosphoryl diester phosphodiesterase
MSTSPLILGHRGASALVPENTLAAFSRAIQDGADGVEFDVRLSRDGVPVVIHDANLKRTGLTNLIVNQLTAAELKEVDVGNWFTSKHGRRSSSQQSYAGETVPTLAEVFDLFATVNGLLYVELKCSPADGAALVQEVVRTIQQARISDRVVVLSFDLPAIASVKEVDAGIRTAALFEPKLRRPSTVLRKLRMIEVARQHRTDELALHYTLATRRVVEEAKASGFETVIWTVDDPAWVKRARSMGVKALMANDPARMLRQRVVLESA